MPLPLPEQARPTSTQRRTNGVDNTHYAGTQAEELGVNYCTVSAYTTILIHVHVQ